MLTVIDFYAENPIVGKTLQSCYLENSNVYDDIIGNGDSDWTIYNSSVIKLSSFNIQNYFNDNFDINWTHGVNPAPPTPPPLWASTETRINSDAIKIGNPASSILPYIEFLNVSQLHIPGGSSGQVLTTDGSSNLSWTTVSGGGSVTDGDYGDITVSGSGSTWTIDNSVVTYAKMQQVTGHTVLGHAGNLPGAVEEITSTASGQVLHRNGSNLVFGTIGDSSITASSITYSRLQNTASASRLLGRGSTSAGTLEEITLGSGLTMSGTTLSVSSSGAQTLVTTFNSSGTWTKQAWAKTVSIYIIAGGGGGGGGARQSTATNRCGGAGGGGGGAYIVENINANTLPATVSVTVGAGGTAGASATVDNTSGGNGGNGGNSTFGSSALNTPYFHTFRGDQGLGGGTATTSTPGSGGSNWSTLGINGGIGGSGRNTTGATPVSGTYYCSGGGGGGGASAGSTVLNPGGSGGSGAILNSIGGGAGAVGNGSQGLALIFKGTTFGQGGGGGGYAPSSVGGTGATGINYGAGGAGGGASDNGFNSGAGGAGAPGVVVIVEIG